MIPFLIHRRRLRLVVEPPTDPGSGPTPPPPDPTLPAQLTDYPAYAVAIEFAPGSMTVVTSYCLGFTYTRALGTPFDTLDSGTALIVLDNGDRRFSPENAASPYAPHLTPARRVQLWAVHSETEYRLWTGFIESIAASPQLGKRNATIRCADRVRKLGKRSVTVGSVYPNINVGSVWTHVLSHLGVDVRSIDPLFDTLPFYWKEENQGGMEVIRELQQIAPTFAYMSADDVLHVKERYWPVRKDSVTNSYEAWLKLDYVLNGDEIINRATVRSRPRAVHTDITTVAWLHDRPYIPASSGIGFELVYRDPFTEETDIPATEMQQPLRVVDYKLNTASSGLGIDRTSTASASVRFLGTSAVCSLFNGSNVGAYVTQFMLRGKPLLRQPEVDIRTEDASSQALYEVRDYVLKNDLIGRNRFAEDYSGYLIQRYAEPRGDITLTLKNQFPDMLSHELGDLLHVVDSHVAVGSQWFVTGMTHTLRFERGTEHEVEYDLEFFRDPEWLILDHSTKGKLDERKVAF